MTIQSVNIHFSKLIMGLFLILVSACAGGKDASGEFQDYQRLEELISSREFQIENQWANPLAGTAINLIGNANYIRFMGDSVAVALPYFGVRHSGGGYGSDGGITFKGPLENLQITENPEEEEIIIEFEGDNGTEILDFYIKLFSNFDTSTTVNSSERDPISYRGEITDLPEEVFD